MDVRVHFEDAPIIHLYKDKYFGLPIGQFKHIFLHIFDENKGS